MDLSKHLVEWSRGSTVWWNYAFPNNHDASVIPDPRQPFRFEVESTDPDDVGSGAIVGGLTSEQVEQKLTKLAGLPQNEDA